MNVETRTALLPIIDPLFGGEPSEPVLAKLSQNGGQRKTSYIPSRTPSLLKIVVILSCVLMV